MSSSLKSAKSPVNELGNLFGELMMAKGFGVHKSQQLGYVLVLMQERYEPMRQNYPLMMGVAKSLLA